jgi:hypothetical protein
MRVDPNKDIGKWKQSFIRTIENFTEAHVYWEVEVGGVMKAWYDFSD